MIRTNIYGAALTARLTLPHLISARGHLILTGALTGHIAISADLYSVTKSAVAALAGAIRVQCIEKHVHITLLTLGSTGTATFWNDPVKGEISVEDVASTVLYILQQPPHVSIDEIAIRPC